MSRPQLCCLIKSMQSSSVFDLSGLSTPTQILDQVINQAIHLKASDILIQPQEKEVLVRFRVDGLFQTFGQMPIGSYDQLLSRVKVLANMDIAESRKSQEGKIKLNVGSRDYVLRVAIVATNFGQMVTMRVLSLPEFTEFESLGMNPELIENVKRNITGRYGLFLVCGPTGSGKTTTIHSCLKYLNQGDINIMTVEDPIEYEVSGINQIEVDYEIGMDFVSSLRTILRLSPDVIFIGEIRDPETAKIAIQASLTGHLVISTIHSRSSVGAVYRLMDLGVDRHIINYALRAILSQRLLRKVCDHCKESYAPTKAEIDFYIKEKGSPPLELVHGHKCDFCHQTRYDGRVGVYEFMEVNDSVRDLISSNPSETEFVTKLTELGYKNMQLAGLDLVDSGVTSIREYIRTVYDAR